MQSQPMHHNNQMQSQPMHQNNILERLNLNHDDKCGKQIIIID